MLQSAILTAMEGKDEKLYYSFVSAFHAILKQSIHGIFEQSSMVLKKRLNYLNLLLKLFCRLLEVQTLVLTCRPWNLASQRRGHVC